MTRKMKKSEKKVNIDKGALKPVFMRV